MGNSTDSQEQLNKSNQKNMPPAYWFGIFGSSFSILILIGIPVARSLQCEWAKTENFNLAVFFLAVVFFTSHTLTELYSEALTSSKNWCELWKNIASIFEIGRVRFTKWDYAILIFIHIIIIFPFLVFLLFPNIKDALKLDDFSVFIKEGAYYYPILAAFLIAKLGFIPFLKYEEPKSSESAESPDADKQPPESTEPAAQSETVKSDNSDNQNKA